MCSWLLKNSTSEKKSPLTRDKFSPLASIGNTHSQTRILARRAIIVLIISPVSGFVHWYVFLKASGRLGTEVRRGPLNVKRWFQNVFKETAEGYLASCGVPLEIKQYRVLATDYLVTFCSTAWWWWFCCGEALLCLCVNVVSLQKRVI